MPNGNTINICLLPSPVGKIFSQARFMEGSKYVLPILKLNNSNRTKNKFMKNLNDF